MRYYGNVMTSTKWRLCVAMKFMIVAAYACPFHVNCKKKKINRVYCCCCRCILHLQQYSRRLNLFFFLNTFFYMATYKQRTKSSPTSCPYHTPHIRLRASSMQLENSEETRIPYTTHSTRRIPRKAWAYRRTNAAITYRNH